MAVALPYAPSFSTSFCCAWTESTRCFLPFTARFRRAGHPNLRLTVSFRFQPSAAGGFVSPENGDLDYELQHGFSPQKRRIGSPVFVKLPIDALTESGQLRRRKAMTQSLRALAAAGVEGVLMEVWWGIVEREMPRVYNWQGYMEIVALAKRCGLKVRAMMAFHQCGTGPGDSYWIPLPQWILEEMDKDPDLAFSDRFGRRNMEYISIGCDTLPVLRGRSPIQAYSDFMKNFRDTFRPFLGVVITGIQVGMGPAGELRYPSCPSHKLTWPWRSPDLGEFQCYDKYMLASLNACARVIGMREWGKGGPIDAKDLMHDPEQAEFFGSDSCWKTPDGHFFLEWYSGTLLLHGDRICCQTESIFCGAGVDVSAKVAGIHWHYDTLSHLSELTAGYYNTSERDGYLPIARMLGRYGFSLCCSCFKGQDAMEKRMNPVSSPKGFLRQLLLTTRTCGVPFEGENSAAHPDGHLFEQVLKMSKLYSDGQDKPCFSFNFVRMDKNFFEYVNWVRFTRFVRQMSEAGIFRARLAFRGAINLSSKLAVARVGMAIG
ncbi:hypothetical protein Nepgr_028572 [Nepenthes gracilis]|uniref:Beta-amylase n=1 Tax=Nepenthes gracilis TaxID=150966 RepID=A0AAD3Y487_NEPGR|nr:hypothetical protein Nepgr_028572 [Nepenthes gracilis]